ncbi:hypothetical protein HNQ77_003005 [Silvibacterium bohemicum]|uniref:Uncharacterized protein n=1 Tax=Silvibacterium bohemicum TaxID=1577686 RepID=A0A841JZB3_9BACT|nr:hypothetical protein [Silvibacterium bohemicum]
MSANGAVGIETHRIVTYRRVDLRNATRIFVHNYCSASKKVARVAHSLSILERRLEKL